MPNEKEDKNPEKTYIHEFIRKIGNFDKGEPNITTILSTRMNLGKKIREKSNASLAREKHYQVMKSYPKELLRQLQSKNEREGVVQETTDENGFASSTVSLPEPPLKLSQAKRD